MPQTGADESTAPVIERQLDDEVVRTDSEKTTSKKAADIYTDEKQSAHVWGDDGPEKVGAIVTSEKHPAHISGEDGVDPESLEGETGPLETAEDIVTHVIAVDDDPTLSPWTFRMFFVGKWPSRPE
jgi:hypothetical protein